MTIVQAGVHIDFRTWCRWSLRSVVLVYLGLFQSLYGSTICLTDVAQFLSVAVVTVRAREMLWVFPNPRDTNIIRMRTYVKS